MSNFMLMWFYYILKYPFICYSTIILLKNLKIVIMSNSKMLSLSALFWWGWTPKSGFVEITVFSKKGTFLRKWGICTRFCHISRFPQWFGGVPPHFRREGVYPPFFWPTLCQIRVFRFGTPPPDRFFGAFGQENGGFGKPGNYYANRTPVLAIITPPT